MGYRAAMPLTTGSRLGPYEIVAPLGAGGMGEVYRARDTRLGREVAVKVLPAHLSTQPEVRARFEREAKTISGLQHPHICTLFDVGHEDGVDFLVMELIEGETLAARLGRGALPPADVLKFGAQIADALERAHRAGVVHRDLKPGNVMLTRGGAKLMDFGLARATGLAAAGSGSASLAMTHSPTVAAPLTTEGTIIGTFQYMSPEQLEGQEADERADLWALGCVLFEMATGRAAFSGRSQATLISAIMTSEPPAVSSLTPLAPPALDRLVRTCLTKDREERARSAHDVKLQLVGMQEASTQSGVAPAVGRSRRPYRASMAWIVAAVATVVAVALAVLLFQKGGRSSRDLAHVLLPIDTGQTPSRYPSSLVISPDGMSVAYVAADSATRAVWVRRFDSPVPKKLFALTEWTGPAAPINWSPDSRQLVVGGNVAHLFKVPVDGGAPTPLCDANMNRGATWSPRGVIVFALGTQTGLYKIPAAGGTPVQVTWPDTARHESGHRFPCFLPDGVHFLFTILPPGPDGFEIRIGSIDSKETKPVLHAQSSVTYAAPGWLLSRRDGKVVAHQFDARSGRVTGEPIRLLDAPELSDLDSEPIASASADGRLLVLDNPAPEAKLAWMSLSGVVGAPLPLPAGPWRAPVLSPDGRFAAIINGDDLWRIDLARAAPLRLTSGGGYHNNPVWSPDGSQLTFSMGGRGREENMVMNSDGSGTPRRLKSVNALFKSVRCWTEAGLLVAALRAGTQDDIFLLDGPDADARPLLASTYSELVPKVSPDNRWLGYFSNEAGKFDLYLQSFPGLGHKVRVTNEGCTMFWWLPSSREIVYFHGPSRRVSSVTLTTRGEEIEVSAPRIWFTLPDGVQSGELTSDGSRFLVLLSKGTEADRRARVVMNWPALTKRD